MLQQTHSKAAKFIVSHISQIVAAEVTAQSIADIDREIGRIYETWKETQDLKIRVDVYLNNKLVGHAGELQDFGLFSLSQKKTVFLPSGQKLLLIIEMDISETLINITALLTVLFLILVAAFYFIRQTARQSVKQLSYPLEQKIAFIKKLSQSLPLTKLSAPEKQSTMIREIIDLDSSITILCNEILKLQENLGKINFDKGKIEMAEQIAHNLKGAIAVANTKVINSTGFSEDDKKQLLLAIQDIFRMSNLMMNITDTEQILSEKSLEFNPSKLVKVVFDEKMEQNRDKIRISLKLVNNIDRNIIVRGSEDEFKSVLSNILDNAIEAIPSSGLVQLVASNNSSFLEIKIIDSGIGISADLLPKLMTYKGTYGKKHGNGLGLFHAKKTILNLKGEITISSSLAEGTVVHIKIPYSYGTTVALNIEMDSSSNVVILDDDPLVHEAWKIKLQPLNTVYSLIHLSSIEEAELWLEQNSSSNGGFVFFSDYKINNATKTGLDVIKEFRIEESSVLITGAASSRRIQNEAAEARVRLCDKADLGSLKLVFKNSNTH